MIDKVHATSGSILGLVPGFLLVPAWLLLCTLSKKR